VFGAFWLVATSAEAVPARDCFTGLTNPTRIAVVLGTPGSDPAAGGSAYPSCAGIDGLAPGATLTFSLTQGPRPKKTADTCWGYGTTALEGTTDVQIQSEQSVAAYYFLTDVGGTYTSSAASTCTGSWRLRLGSFAALDHPISPLDASNGGWIVERSIIVGDPQTCMGPIKTGEPPAGCDDTFPVVSITQLAP